MCEITSLYQPKFYHYSEVVSTMDTAFELLNSGSSCVVVTADWQSSGRGRNGKIWESEKSLNFLFTFAFRHSTIEVPIYLLQVIGSLATYKLLKNHISKNNIKLKYPNDIYAKPVINEKKALKHEYTTGNYKKIAGIISESNYISSDICYSAIGIGINLNKTPIIENFDNSIALCECVEESINFHSLELAKHLSEHLISLLNKSEILIKNEWKNLLNIFNKKIYIQNEPNKIYYVNNILEDCRLELKDAHGIKKNINNGDSIKYDLN